MHAARRRADGGDAAGRGAGAVQGARAPHRRRRGAPAGRAHVRRADRHRHGREEPVRGRSRGTGPACAGGAGQAAAASPRCRRYFRSSRASVSSRASSRLGLPVRTAAPASTQIIPLRVPAPPAPAKAPAAAAPAEIADDYRITRAPMLHVVPSAPREIDEPTPLRARAGLADRLERVEAPAPRSPSSSNDNDARQEEIDALRPAALLSHARDRMSSTVLRSGPRRPSGCIRMAS